MYTPEPMDTNDIVLPEDILALAEELAANTHDVWAKGRIQQGWTYGPVRDDTAKTTPCLVPYDNLPESEKDYDRATALETLRMIVKLGYTIEKSQPNVTTE